MSNIVFSNVVKKLLDDFGQYGNSTVTGLPFYCDKVVVQKWLTEHHIINVKPEEIINTLCSELKPVSTTPPSPMDVPITSPYVEQDIIETHLNECGCSVTCWEKYVPKEIVYNVLASGNCTDEWKDARTWYERLPTAFTREGLRNWVINTFGVKITDAKLDDLIKQMLNVPIIYLVRDNDKEWYVKMEPPTDVPPDPYEQLASHEKKLRHFLKDLTSMWTGSRYVYWGIIVIRNDGKIERPFWFNKDSNLLEVIEYVRKHDNGKNLITFTANPRPKQLPTQGGRNSVPYGNLFVVDIDVEPVSNAVISTPYCHYDFDYGTEYCDGKTVYRTGAPSEVIKKLNIKPDLVVFSGRGLHYYFFSSKPISSDAYETIAKKILSQFFDTKSFGWGDETKNKSEVVAVGKIDKSTLTIEHLIRLPYTINSKTGKRAEVIYDALHPR